MKRALFLALILALQMGFSALAEVDPILVRQQTLFDCGPAAIYDALLLSGARDSLLKSLSYKAFLQSYGSGRFKDGVGTELSDVAEMAKEALQDFYPSELSLQFVNLRSLLSRDGDILDRVYQEFASSFEKGFNPIVGIGFRNSRGDRHNGHAVMVYQIEQMEQSLVLSYLDPQDLSLGELFISQDLHIRSDTLFSESSTPLWTLDGIIKAH